MSDTLNKCDSLSSAEEKGLSGCIEDIKDIEREKAKNKEKTPIPQSILFTLFGLMIAFISVLDVNLTSSLCFSFQHIDKNNAKISVQAIKYFLLFISGLFMVKFHIRKPKIYHLYLAILYTFTTYSSSYFYTRNHTSFIILSKIFCFIFILFYYGISNTIKLKKKLECRLSIIDWIGLLLALIGIFMEYISTYKLDNNDDEFNYIFHYNDHYNYFISFINGIAYFLILVLFANYCTKSDMIHDAILYYSLYSCIFCILIGLCYSELGNLFSTFKNYGVSSIYYVITITTSVIELVLVPYYIKKCSLNGIGIVFSLEMVIRTPIYLMVLKIEKEEAAVVNIFSFLSPIFTVIGLFIICYYHISENYKEKLKLGLEKTYSGSSEETESNHQKFPLLNDEKINS